ncbi:hypothetical protein HAX54_016234 [Datura stramonium]|uniref:Uncharacterized protein n=1 Tax=Datura stramonium TaxID=4076 RepID=A0ABS8UJ86_DATST|nr:hypothetical protein [Datura stramonium]
MSPNPGSWFAFLSFSLYPEFEYQWRGLRKLPEGDCRLPGDWRGLAREVDVSTSTKYERRLSRTKQEVGSRGDEEGGGTAVRGAGAGVPPCARVADCRRDDD